KWMVLLVLLGIVAAATHRAALWEGEVSVARLYNGLDTRADSLLMGCAVGLLTAGNRLQRASWLFVVNRSMLVVLLPFVGYALVTFSSVSAFLYRGGFTLVSATAAIAIIELLNAPPGLVVRVMESPPLVWVGRLSYGLYLCNFPVCYILTIP